MGNMGQYGVVHWGKPERRFELLPEFDVGRFRRSDRTIILVSGFNLGQAGEKYRTAYAITGVPDRTDLVWVMSTLSLLEISPEGLGNCIAELYENRRQRRGELLRVVNAEVGAEATSTRCVVKINDRLCHTVEGETQERCTSPLLRIVLAPN